MQINRPAHINTSQWLMAKGQQKNNHMHLDMFLIILRNTWSAHTCEKVGQLEKVTQSKR